MTTHKYSFSKAINALRNMLSKKESVHKLNNHKINIRNYKKPYQWPKKNILPQQNSRASLRQHAWKEE